MFPTDKASVDVGSVKALLTTKTWLVRTSLQDLLSPSFLAALNQPDSQIRVIPKSARADRTNSFAILPLVSPSRLSPGLPPRLLLSVDSSTYASLGLVGKALEKSLPKAKFPPQRYLITLDLSPEKFKKKIRSRVLWVFTNRLEPVECLISSELDSLPLSASATFRSIEPEWSSFNTESVRVPKTPSTDVDDTEIAEFYEWAGLIRCGIPYLPTEDPSHDWDILFDSLPAMPSRLSYSVIRVRGFLSPRILTPLLTSCIQGRPDWMLVTFSPFTDTPVIMHHHSFIIQSEQIYCTFSNMMCR